MQKKEENNEEYFKDEMLNEIENLNIVKNYKDLPNNLNYRNNSKKLIKSKSFNYFESTGLNKIDNINYISKNIESVNNVNTILQCLLNIKKFFGLFPIKERNN